MALTLIGQKKGMAQVFDAEGKAVVCTVIQVRAESRRASEASRNRWVFGDSARRGASFKISCGKFDKAPQRAFCESRSRRLLAFKGICSRECEPVSGGPIDRFDVLAGIAYVDVQGVTKGKGFQGVIKLHGFAGGPGAHGSGFHRHAGSTGQRSTPGRCYPNGKRASRMGGDVQTVQSLRVVAIKGDLLLVEGAVPGAKDGVVYIAQAKKKQHAKKK